jgi:hypothetical protein
MPDAPREDLQPARQLRAERPLHCDIRLDDRALEHIAHHATQMAVARNPGSTKGFQPWRSSRHEYRRAPGESEFIVGKSCYGVVSAF